jgi:hypothetical protein
MKYLLTLILLLTLLVPVGITSAGDPAIGSPDDNACNAGGVMDGKCTTEWHWVCGWYLARLNKNLITRAQFPAQCSSLLAPLPDPAPFVRDFLCIKDIGGAFDISFPAFNGVAERVTVYVQFPVPLAPGVPATCTGGVIVTFPAFYGSAAEATVACPLFNAPMALFFPAPFPSNLYYCL